MSDRNGGGGGPEARGTGSSLTDAVVAALANVSSPPPPTSTPPAAPAPAPAPVPAEAAKEEVKQAAPEPAAVEIAKSAPTVITGTPEPAATASADPPREEASPSPPAEPPRGDATIPTVTATPSADVTQPAPAQPEPPESTTSSGEGGAPSEPTMRLGGAPIETIAKDASASTAAGIAIEYYGRTDVGLVREHNEDNYLVADLTAQRRGNDGAILKTTLGERGLVLAVCDGMGGAAAGEVASQMAVDTIHEILQAGGPPKDRDAFARRLVRSIEEAGARIFSAAKMDRTRRGMGTTSTVAGLIDSTLFVGQVGDSRAYVLRGDQFALITKDQSLVNQLIEAGQLTEEEAEAFEHSNIILQALGTTEEVTVDLTFLELRRGDRLLMCSDGLSGLVHADMMREVLKSSRDLSEAAQQLIAMANAGGGHDNITVIIAEFDGQALRETSAEARVAYQQYPLPPEDPSEAAAAGKSATAIKSGGPKPGADVKSGEVREAAAAEGAGGSRLWVFAVIVLLVLIGIAAVILMMDDGEHEGAAEETTRVTIASEVSSDRRAAAPAATGRIVVRTDAEEGVLFVNGAPSASSGAGEETTLTLPAGAYRLELRQGDVRIADATVTLEAGEEERVTLSMPAGAIPEPGVPLVGLAATEVPAPSGDPTGAPDPAPSPSPAQRAQEAQQAAPPAPRPEQPPNTAPGPSTPAQPGAVL